MKVGATLGAAVLSTAFLARDAEAGCGFYAAGPSGPAETALVNDADQIAVMREGTRFALTMSTNYKGPLEDFAMVVPVPVVLKSEDVKTLEPSVFRALDRSTAPKLVEYWERDPCFDAVESATAGAEGKSGGSGDKRKGGAPGGGAPQVTVEAQFVSGEYEIVVLGANESDAVEAWLIDHRYKIPKGASAALAPYVAEQQKFVVAKVDAKKVKKDAQGTVVLSPLRFVYESADLRIPVRLGLLNAPGDGKGRQDLIMYVLAKGRVESANYANAFIPTNVDLDPKALDVFAGFYSAMFDATVQQAGGRAVVTEHARGVAPGELDGAVRAVGGDVLRSMTATTPAPSDLVLTRLHTRYDAATLSADLVFKLADPVAGGRDEEGAETTPHASKANDFRARYAVRHEYFGNVSCPDPVHGVWGGPPKGKAPRNVQAVDGSEAPRDVQWASLVKSPVHALGVKLEAPRFGSAPTVGGTAARLGYWAPRSAAALAVVVVGGAVLLVLVRAVRARRALR